MPRTGERENARQKLIEFAAIYLDAGGVLDATILESLPAGARLEIHLRVLPDSPQTGIELSGQGAGL